MGSATEPLWSSIRWRLWNVEIPLHILLCEGAMDMTAEEATTMFKGLYSRKYPEEPLEDRQERDYCMRLCLFVFLLRKGILRPYRCTKCHRRFSEQKRAQHEKRTGHIVDLDDTGAHKDEYYAVLCPKEALASWGREKFEAVYKRLTIPIPRDEELIGNPYTKEAMKAIEVMAAVGLDQHKLSRPLPPPLKVEARP